MVPSDYLRRAGYTFDRDLNEWNQVEDRHHDKIGNTLRVGDDLEFTVEKLHECNGVISLEGCEPVVVKNR